MIVFISLFFLFIVLPFTGIVSDTNKCISLLLVCYPQTLRQVAMVKVARGATAPTNLTNFC